MGKPWGWRTFDSALPVPWGSPWASPCCATHFFGKLLPGTIQIPDVKPIALAHLQLVVVEEFIGNPENGLMGPGRGRTVPGVGAMWVQNPLRHCATRTAGALPSPTPAGPLGGSGGQILESHAHQSCLAQSLPAPSLSPPVVPEQFGDELWVVSSTRLLVQGVVQHQPLQQRGACAQ